ncbi:ligand-gated ion channel [Oceanomicrobium pacificus]|uniref:Neurotransmitter-gated ion-channel ligand-binding domain-containing protein n=1 Tax=Oceanomicrobium pacificus TaxID=2692916 RepID=A0A6B0TND1_9RHOB|nr:hypothetical protein [Oceanomicrobium pacificus]MXU65366.1 hypothetical protein [Oceanomicrobium pacificus]
MNRTTRPASGPLAPLLRLLLVMALLPLWSGSAIAQATPAPVQACALPAFDTNVRPGAGDGPTDVEIGMIVADVLGIDDVNQQIEGDFLMVLEWTDKRLADFGGCRFPITQVWFPPANLLNSSNLRATYTQARNQVSVAEGGRVTYLQRLTGTISSYHDLHKFPFDRQQITMEFASPSLGVDEFQFVPMVDGARLADTLNIEDWDIRGVTISAANSMLSTLQEERSIAAVTIDAARYYGFFLFKIITPLTLIVAMSWTVFWIPPQKFEAQIGFAATSMLTLIAFQLTTSSILPRLNYFTTLDWMLFGATLLVFAALLEALYTGTLARRGREAQAQRIDYVCRFVFPAAFVLFWGGTVITSIR